MLYPSFTPTRASSIDDSTDTLNDVKLQVGLFQLNRPVNLHHMCLCSMAHCSCLHQCPEIRLSYTLHSVVSMACGSTCAQGCEPLVARHNSNAWCTAFHSSSLQTIENDHRNAEGSCERTTPLPKSIILKLGVVYERAERGAARGPGCTRMLRTYIEFCAKPAT